MPHCRVKRCLTKLRTLPCGEWCRIGSQQADQMGAGRMTHQDKLVCISPHCAAFCCIGEGGGHIQGL